MPFLPPNQQRQSTEGIQHGFDTAAYTQTDPPMNSTGPGAESDIYDYFVLFVF